MAVEKQELVLFRIAVGKLNYNSHFINRERGGHPKKTYFFFGSRLPTDILRINYRLYVAVDKK